MKHTPLSSKLLVAKRALTSGKLAFLGILMAMASGHAQAAPLDYPIGTPEVRKCWLEFSDNRPKEDLPSCEGEKEFKDADITPDLKVTYCMNNEINQDICSEPVAISKAEGCKSIDPADIKPGFDVKKLVGCRVVLSQRYNSVRYTGVYSNLCSTTIPEREMPPNDAIYEDWENTKSSSSSGKGYYFPYKTSSTWAFVSSWYELCKKEFSTFSYEQASRAKIFYDFDSSSNQAWLDELIDRIQPGNSSNTTVSAILPTPSKKKN